MKIKGIRYTGPIFDNSGYARACRGNIMALYHAGVPLNLNPISFEKASPDFGEDGKILKSLVDNGVEYNVNMIHSTPEFWAKYKINGMINVGYTIWETTKLHPDWPKYINNTVDKVLVGCSWNEDVFRNSGITIPIGVVPHGINMKEFNNTTPFQIAGVKETDFMFYSIMQWQERKHPMALLKGYFSAFSGVKDVVLVLKTYRSDYSDREKDAIRETIKRLKLIMPMDHYPKIAFLSNMLSEDEIVGLHTRGDCYVSFDRGEGFGLCIASDTKILIPNGIKNADCIKKGDEVLSIDGEFHKVTAVTKKYIDKGLEFSIKLHQNIKVSQDHPFFTTSTITNHKRYNWSSKKIETSLVWKKAVDIKKGDYVAIPKPLLHKELNSMDIYSIVNENIIVENNMLWYKSGYSVKNTKYSYKNLVIKYGYTKKIFEIAVTHIKNNTVPKNNSKSLECYNILRSINYTVKTPNKINRYIDLNDSVLFLFGWYLAEGSTNNDTFLEMNFHRKEISIAREMSKIFQLYFGVSKKSIFIQEYGNKSRIIVSSKIIAKLFSSLFGKKAHNKHLPTWLFNSGVHLSSLLHGLFEGDGHNTGAIYALTTTSVSLAYQVKSILNSLGYCPRIALKKKPMLGNYSPYIISIANNDYLDFIGQSKKETESKHYIETDNFFLVKITAIQPIKYNNEMIDFSVENAESFVGNGILLHNCPFQAGAGAKPIVITGFGGALEYAKEDNSYLIDYQLTPVFGMPWTKWYKGDQNWAEPNVIDGASKMLQVYNNREEAKQKGLKLQKYISENFSWEVIANKIIKEIEEIK